MTVAAPSQMAQQSSRVEVRFGTSKPQRRWTILIRVILVIPQAIVLLFVGIGAGVVMFLGWFAALFTGRLPESFARFLLGYLRWSTRVNAYTYFLTDVYPPFALDPDPGYPVDVAVTTGRLNRAAVFFRIILVVPASIVEAVLIYGLAIFGIVIWVAALILGRVPDAFFGASAAAIRWQTRTNGYFTMLTSYYPSDVLGDKDSSGRRIEATTSGTLERPPTAPGGGWGGPPPTAPSTYAWGTPGATASAPVPPPPPFLPPGSPTMPPPLAPPPMGTVPPPEATSTPPASAAPASGGPLEVPGAGDQPGAPLLTPTPTPTPGPVPEAPVGPVPGVPVGVPPLTPPPVPPGTQPPVPPGMPPGAQPTVPPPPPGAQPTVPPPPPPGALPVLPPPPPAGSAPPPPPGVAAEPGAGGPAPYPTVAGGYPPATGSYPSGPPAPPGAIPPAPPGALPPPPPPGALPPPPPGAMPPLPPGPQGVGYGASIVGLWPLALSKGARTLTVVFIVLGALVYGGLQVFNFGFSGLFQKAIARVEVQNAYSQVETATTTFQSALRACQGLTVASATACSTAAAGNLATSLESYETTLTNVNFPTSVQVQASAAESAATNAVSEANNLAASTTLQQFSSLIGSPSFLEAFRTLGTTYNELDTALGG